MRRGKRQAKRVQSAQPNNHVRDFRHPEHRRVNNPLAGLAYMFGGTERAVSQYALGLTPLPAHSGRGFGF